MTPLFNDLNIPTLIIWGKYDEIIPVSIGRRLQKQLPQATLMIIDKVGHIPQEEKPQETLKLIQNFLQNNTIKIYKQN